MPGTTRGQFHPRLGVRVAGRVPEHYRSFSIPLPTDPEPAYHPGAYTEPADRVYVYPNGQYFAPPPNVTNGGTDQPLVNAASHSALNPGATPFETVTNPLVHPPVNNTDWAQQTIEEFKLYFGNDPSDLNAWQRICWHCSVPEAQIPDTIEGCRAVSQVNLPFHQRMYPQSLNEQ